MKIHNIDEIFVEFEKNLSVSFQRAKSTYSYNPVELVLINQKIEELHGKFTGQLDILFNEGMPLTVVCGWSEKTIEHLKSLHTIFESKSSSIWSAKVEAYAEIINSAEEYVTKYKKFYLPLKEKNELLANISEVVPFIDKNSVHKVPKI